MARPSPTRGSKSKPVNTSCRSVSAVLRACRCRRDDGRAGLARRAVTLSQPGPRMIALIQRVKRAEVRVGERVTGAIDAGLLALVCAERGDTDASAEKLLAKVLGYRVFSDAAGKMNLPVTNIDGEGRAGGLLLVSQFTLAADTN